MRAAAAAHNHARALDRTAGIRRQHPSRDHAGSGGRLPRGIALHGRAAAPAPSAASALAPPAHRRLLGQREARDEQGQRGKQE